MTAKLAAVRGHVAPMDFHQLGRPTKHRGSPHSHKDTDGFSNAILHAYYRYTQIRRQFRPGSATASCRRRRAKSPGNRGTCFLRVQSRREHHARPEPGDGAAPRLRCAVTHHMARGAQRVHRTLVLGSEPSIIAAADPSPGRCPPCPPAGFGRHAPSRPRDDRDVTCRTGFKRHPNRHPLAESSVSSWAHPHRPGQLKPNSRLRPPLSLR
jgi:hypothetical protein